MKRRAPHHIALDHDQEGELGPLSGIHIVEFAGIGPDPIAVMLLADLGATVLRLDRTVPSDLGVGLFQTPVSAINFGTGVINRAYRTVRRTDCERPARRSRLIGATQPVTGSTVTWANFQSNTNVQPVGARGQPCTREKRVNLYGERGAESAVWASLPLEQAPWQFTPSHCVNTMG